MLRGTMRQWDNTEVERAKGPMWRILGLGAAASTLTRPCVEGEDHCRRSRFAHCL
jgi:hypothetical protein